MTEKQQLPECFVIQPFDDGGTYDKRYRETIRPALIDAEVTPVRGDEILGLTPIIQKVEDAIRSAPLCLAEVTEDNPNVWLELGYALALDRPTIIICEKSIRPRLPFDIHHRPVIYYQTDSLSGFEKLKTDIIRDVRGVKREASRVLVSPVLKEHGGSDVDLKDYEVEILIAVFSSITSELGFIEVQNVETALARKGFKSVAFTLGVVSLKQRGLISESVEMLEYGSGGYDARVLQIEPSGIEWIQSNEKSLVLKKTKAAQSNSKTFEDFVDDDIPF